MPKKTGFKRPVKAVRTCRPKESVPQRKVWCFCSSILSSWCTPPFCPRFHSLWKHHTLISAEFVSYKRGVFRGHGLVSFFAPGTIVLLIQALSTMRTEVAAAFVKNGSSAMRASDTKYPDDNGEQNQKYTSLDTIHRMPVFDRGRKQQRHDDA